MLVCDWCGRVYSEEMVLQTQKESYLKIDKALCPQHREEWEWRKKVLYLLERILKASPEPFI